MRLTLALLVPVLMTPIAGVGCNAILDIHQHAIARMSDAGAILESGADPPPAVPAALFAALYTVGRVPDDASVGYLPDGGRVTLTDDGFELAGTLCRQAICVTGALTP
ncbi:MAG: hypothetical protein M3O46_05440 [Myxococcota bacterium]|nr:hypothetical protein [Myxococcota bacterium]